MNLSSYSVEDSPKAASRPLAALIIAAVVLLMASSCAQFPALQERFAAKPPAPEPEPEPAPGLEAQEEPQPADVLWEWTGKGRNVSHIWIDVDAQRARFYDGAEQIGWTFIASGRKSHPTPVGKFAVMEKVSKKRSNIYGKIYNASGKVVKSNAKLGRDRIPPGGRFVGAKMPYFMRLTYDGIGLHAGPIPVPGSPASHGCIRMPHQVAPLLYQHVALGTPVTVTGKGPNYGNYAEKRRREREAQAAAEAAAAEAAISQARATDLGAGAEGDAGATAAAPTGEPATPQEQGTGLARDAATTSALSPAAPASPRADAAGSGEQDVPALSTEAQPGGPIPAPAATATPPETAPPPAPSPASSAAAPAGPLAAPAGEVAPPAAPSAAPAPATANAQLDTAANEPADSGTP